MCIAMKAVKTSDRSQITGKDAFGITLQIGDKIIACRNVRYPLVKGTVIKLGKAQATYLIDGYGDYKFCTDYAHVAKI